MAMELKQSLKLSQQLVMTPQLQQAIKLLQLSRMELLEQVREEMEQNPLLEQPDEQAVGDVTDKEPGEASLEAENLEVPRDLDVPQGDTATEVKGEGDGPPEIDWEAYLNSYQFNEQTTASNKGNVATDDLPSFEANLVKREDLFEHLAVQLGVIRLNDDQLTLEQKVQTRRLSRGCGQGARRQGRNRRGPCQEERTVDYIAGSARLARLRFIRDLGARVVHIVPRVGWIARDEGVGVDDPVVQLLVSKRRSSQ